MRTLEIEDELFEQAEAEAIRRGVTVKDFVKSAVVRDLGVVPNVSRTGRRVEFPIIDSGLPGTLNITPETIRQVEFEDDMRRSGLLSYE